MEEVSAMKREKKKLPLKLIREDIHKKKKYCLKYKSNIQRKKVLSIEISHQNLKVNLNLRNVTKIEHF